MPVIKGREANQGTTSIEMRYGAIQSKTRTFHKDIDSSEILEDALAEDLSMGAARATARMLAPKSNGDIMMEVTLSRESFDLGQIQWQFNVVSLQERTTTDVDGNPILVEYPPSTTWASTITSNGGDYITSFQYTTYETQTGEAEKYIPSCEITGQRVLLVPAGGIINHLTNELRPWFYTINETAFMGFEKGNVLCMGVDFRPIDKREDGQWLCEERYKFMTRPGHPLSVEGENCGGWNTWHVWKDPNSGYIPEDVWDVIGENTYRGVVEKRHYKYKDFTVLYKYSS